MRLDFASSRLRRQLASNAEVQKAYGDRAKRIKMRLDVLELAANLSEVPREPPLRWHQLSGEWDGCFAVDISGNWRIIFKPDHNPVPKRDDGSIDLTAITAIRILEIIDYH